MTLLYTIETYIMHYPIYECVSLCTGEGDGGGGAEGPSPPKNSVIFWGGNYHVKFGHFVNFPAKMSCPSQS